jgi:hypothetical protein
LDIPAPPPEPPATAGVASLPPPPPPFDVIFENIESDPVPPCLGEFVAPVPPAPTVTGTDKGPYPVTVAFVPPGNEVL